MNYADEDDQDYQVKKLTYETARNQKLKKRLEEIKINDEIERLKIEENFEFEKVYREVRFNLSNNFNIQTTLQLLQKYIALEKSRKEKKFFHLWLQFGQGKDYTTLSYQNNGFMLTLTPEMLTPEQRNAFFQNQGAILHSVKVYRIN